ncbi:MAG: cytochrome c [Planctomycetes bacterium]|nr:cytochrome c [Planctomycetota bacterium]
MRERTLVATIAICAVLSSCGTGEKTERGIELMPDMYHTPAFKSMQAMEVSKDETIDGTVCHVVHHVSAMIPPVAGTIPRGGPGYEIAAEDWASARKLANPLSPTRDVLIAGQHAFNIYCAVCHGRDGNAEHGYIAKNFPGVKSVNGANVAAYSDGELYHIMTLGKGLMPNYRAQLLPQTRWAVAHYLRTLTRATMVVADLEKTVQDAELDLRENPGDAIKQSAVETGRSLLEQRRRDLDSLQKIGEDAGREFVPLADPTPEYVVPVWPESDGEHAGGEHPK